MLRVSRLEWQAFSMGTGLLRFVPSRGTMGRNHVSKVAANDVAVALFVQSVEGSKGVRNVEERMRAPADIGNTPQIAKQTRGIHVQTKILQ